MSIDRRTFLAATAAASIASASGGAIAQGKKYRACVIGDTKDGGYGHDVHLIFKTRPDVEVVGLADPDEAGRAQRAADCGAKTQYADYKEMLAKEKPDLVAVCPRTTPRHKEYLLACAEIGAHGFIEKPLCVDLAEADEIIAAIDAKKLKWTIGFNFRSTPLVQHARKLLVEDRIVGSILEVRSRGKEDDRAGGEDLIVLGVHLFDMINFLFGKPQWCYSDITFNGKPATKENVTEATEPLGPIVGNRITAAFGLGNGVPAFFSSMKSKDGNGGRWGIDVYGTQGVMSIRQNIGPEIFVLKDSSWSPGGSDKKWEPLPNAPQSPDQGDHLQRYSIIVNDLIDSIEKDKQPVINLNSGRDALELIQAVFDSCVQGKRVEIPVEDRTHPLKRWA
ncbi:MAG: Gfo/Idh/MocA family oxidoreductase [Candidatus Hydrogenedentes bacterium]|nr:Gfo/Idh/MocA family oxidoreductase [Candidatus Hydrogenedentota bacterium]